MYLCVCVGVSTAPTPPSKGAYPYDCPGEQLLDVSWHITANPAPGGLNSFLMDPNLAAVVGVSERRLLC